jgi:dTDP-glucose 4,6-dehydratase
MKSLFLAGGTGFFGRSFINAFINGKLSRWGVGELIISARNASGFAQANPEYCKPNITFLDLDVAAVCEMPICDYAMHFANSSDKASYEKNLQKEILNIEKSMKAFVKSFESSVSDPSHMLYASSGAVYGHAVSKTFSEYDKVSDSNGFSSLKKHYAAAKIISEQIFHQLKKNSRNLSIARCYSFVGPELPLDTHFVVGNLIQNVLSHEALKITDHRPVVRSYLHTDDLITWLMEALLNGSTSCRTFNVGSDDSIEIHDLARQLANHFELPTEIASRSEDNADWYVPNIKMARSIGLDVSLSSIEAIIKTVDEIQANSSRHSI